MATTQDGTIAGLHRAITVLKQERDTARAERDGALAREAALAEVLNVINRSPGDPGPVFEAILEKAHRLCGADLGALTTYDGVDLRTVVSRGYSEAAAALVRGPNSPSPAQQTLIAGERYRHIPDVRAIEFGADQGFAGGIVEITGLRTFLMVPLRKDGIVRGFLTAHRLEVRPFSEQEIALLESFAAQAVIALENARLITEQREALEQQTATAEVLQVINASPGDLAPVFDAMLEKAMRLCEAAFGELYGFDGEGFPSLALKNVPAAYAASRRAGPVKPIPGSFAARFIAGEYVIHIPDLKEEDAYRSGNAVRRAMVDLGGARTAIAVALHVDDQIRGALIVYRQEVRPFSGKQIAVLENFAAQAVIAMENGRLLTEQQEALERQTATAEVLQVINTSPGNPVPVFDAILEKAMRLCDAAFGMFNTYDGTSFSTVVTRGVPAAFAAFRARHPPIPGPSTPIGRALETKRPVHVVDWLEEPAYKVGTPGGRAIADLGGARTVLNVPLVKETAVLGMVSFYRQQVRPFSDKQIALLENFAAQAVIAMENARLINEQREALEQQTATAEVLQVINASPGNLQPVFDTMLEKAMRLCEAAFGSLYTFDGQRFRSAAQRGVPAAYAAFRERHPPELVGGAGLEQAVRTRRAVQITDMMAERPYLDGNPNVRAMVELGGMRTGVVVPLCKDEAVLGVISIYRQEVRVFTDKEIALLENFAAQAVIAMENARLLTEQQEALEQQTATAEVLQIINSSPGNLAPVFDAILEKAHALCGAATGSLQLYDGEFFRAVATRGLPDEFSNILRQPHRSGLLDALLRDVPFIQIADIADPALTGGDKTLAVAHDIAGVRTYLRLPLRKDDALLGVIIAGRREVRPFSQKEISLLQSFAAQAVIAMENARLLEEIRQRQAELRVTFDNMADGVAMFDGKLRLAAWNRNFQELLDIPAAVLAECPTYAEYLRILAERGEFGTEDIEAELGRRLEHTDRELRLERARPNGQVIEVRRNAVPDGGFVLIYSDITERKRSEAEIRAARDAAEAAYRDLKAAQANLIQAEKMASLGQLTAGIAHEIKNPLNFVNNFAALSVDLLSELKEAAEPGFAALTEKQRADIDDVSAMLTSNLEKITEHGKRADGIVKAMLEHSRGSSAERRMVDLNALIDEALNLGYHGARAQDQSFNITLERDFAEGIAPIEVNPQDMTRVFLNIFSNGFYAANRRGRNGGDAGFVPMLRVTTRDTGEVVEIRVRDNGTGIPADIRDKLFQPFFTTKPTGEGTGLGLSITYDIVTKQHGGTITVNSEVNEFTEFVITLPRQMFPKGGDRA